MLDPGMRDKLVHAVTRYDIGQEKRAKLRLAAYHNIYALPQYDNFNDRLLIVLERAAGVPVTCGGGGEDRGRPA